MNEMVNTKRRILAQRVDLTNWRCCWQPIDDELKLGSDEKNRKSLLGASDVHFSFYRYTALSHVTIGELS